MAKAVSSTIELVNSVTSDMLIRLTLQYGLLAASVYLLIWFHDLMDSEKRDDK
jgi:hypothetical protein